VSGYQTLAFRLKGIAPLLMHSARLADPLSSQSRLLAQITGKRKKTDADHMEAARREWFGGLYVDEAGAPCIPALVLEAAIVGGAKKEKRGPQAKAGLFVEAPARLDYDGPRDLDALWADERFRLRVPVKVGTARVMRTRPRFDGWAAVVVVKFLPELLNAAEVQSFLVSAGEQIGIGDWRPRFGRFTVEAA
jgi:hypothetical protein